MPGNIFVFSTRLFTHIALFTNKISSRNSIFTVFKNINISSRKYITYSEDSDKCLDIPSLSEFKSKKCAGGKFIVPKLQELFNISNTQAKDLYKNYPTFKNFSSEDIARGYELCIEARINQNTLMKYPLLMVTENLSLKLKIMRDLKADINLLAPLILGNIFELKKIVEYAKMEEHYVPFKNRIIYISHILDLPADEVAEKMIKHLYVLRLPVSKLENILNLLLGYGIEPKNILNDCWALRYSTSLAEKRLQRALDSNVIKIKTWMIRCTDQVFERCINRQVENRKILGSNSTVEDYLSKRLECSLENAKYLTEKYPAITKMNISKMKEILDYLYEQGYTPAHVCRVPRILIHSQETTKQRIQQLRQLGYVPPSLAILCKSKRDFDKTLKKYIKRIGTNNVESVNQNS